MINVEHVYPIASVTVKLYLLSTSMNKEHRYHRPEVAEWTNKKDMKGEGRGDGQRAKTAKRP
ncbi:hypothetical protein ABEB36_005886 [Hypothenemus hampei]|uniref:Uncharacterized protein n=1 Tax=Hypothenemus hampei TaxID=57062 RepID=A0ABD1EZR7_HYPHA